VKDALKRFDEVSLALVGIGSVDPSQLLALSGNVFSPEELDQLRQQGAVGDVCLRFFDVNGNPIENALDNRVIGMQLEQLRKVERSVGIAGGKRKFEAIRGALRGKLINVLITDRRTAERLIEGQ
jgi:DNA-binding transcriptional regulator LsrR (DeoR family)